MRIKAPVLLLLAGLLALAPTLAGASTLWQVDAPHCAATFTIKHILAQVPGRFNKFEGQVRFDPEDLAGSSISFTIQAASVDTGVQKRDDHLRSADFFDAEKFPTITFTSTAITHQGGENYLAKGRLTIKDVTQEIELPFQFLGTKAAPMRKGVEVAGFEAFTELDRLAFKVGDGKFYRMGVVGKEVELAIYLELIRQP